MYLLSLIYIINSILHTKAIRNSPNIGNCETGIKNGTNCAGLTMQHRPALATLQLVAVHKTLKYSV